MDGIALIVGGDHFGLAHAANQAIEEAFETGMLTCASLAVVSPWAAEAVVLAGKHPEWELGLQLQLHSPTAGCRWGPVAGAAAVPSLVATTGHFHPTIPTTATADDVVRELEAQVDRALAWGIKPAYLGYVSSPHPAVEETLPRLSERLGAPARMTDWGIQPLRVGSSEEPFSIAGLLEALRNLTVGTYLWVTHPAQETPETWAIWGEETAGVYQREALALGDPGVCIVLRERGISLVSFRQHLETRLGTEPDE
jgi:predicted glycoside hydrolase/deacetylase ChbG (UPF0249 family)